MIFLGLMMIAGIFLATLYGTYRYTFGADAKRLAGDEEIPDWDVPVGLAEYVHNNIELMKKTPSQKVTIVSKDGVKLCGRFYQMQKTAPVILYFHGYRSSTMRDGMGAFKLGYNNGYNVLLVDQRAHHESGGKTITFGENDRMVPCEMCKENYEACASEKELLLVPGADHGMSYAFARKQYQEMLYTFAKKYIEKIEEKEHVQ